MLKTLVLFSLISTPLGEHFTVENPARCILMFPSAGSTALTTWNAVFAEDVELLESTRTEVFIYEPIDNLGFYKGYEDTLRLRVLIYNLSKRNIPIIFSGGSMGAWGALRYYSTYHGGNIRGVYAVSPPINLASGYQEILDNSPNLYFLAERIKNYQVKVYPFLTDLPNTYVVFGDSDNLIGTVDERREMMYTVLEGGGFVQVLKGLGHTDPELWSVSNLISFSIRQCK